MGSVYLVPTPIGNKEDITLRAINILNEKHYFFCEDTRNTRKLLNILGIDMTGKKLFSFFEKNRQHTEKRLQQMSELLAQGKDIVLLTDAGTPNISDPAITILQKFAGKYEIIPLPGPSALSTVLSIIPWHYENLVFWGFCSRKKGELITRTMQLKYLEKPVLVYFDSPNRYKKNLLILREILDGASEVAVFRELTKIHEEKLFFQLGDIAEVQLIEKGEIVVALKPLFKSAQNEGYKDDIRALKRLGVSTSAISQFIANKYGLSKNEVYKVVTENEK